MIYEHKTDLRVRYAETDQMGIVHHSSFIIYYEEARTNALRNLGIGYADIEKRGIFMPVVDLSIRYHLPARYDEQLTIITSLSELPSSKMIFHYQTYNTKNELLNSGSTTLAFVNKETNRPCRVPAWLLEMMQQTLDQK